MKETKHPSDFLVDGAHHKAIAVPDKTPASGLERFLVNKIAIRDEASAISRSHEPATISGDANRRCRFCPVAVRNVLMTKSRTSLSQAEF